MRTVQILAVLGLAAFTTGCTVRSLYPLYTAEDLVFEPRLVGAWPEKDSQDTWIIRPSGQKAYEVTVSTEPRTRLRDSLRGTIEAISPSGERAREVSSSGSEEKDRLKGHLVRLGNLRFLDLCPEGIDDSVAIPAHLFVQIRLEGDILRIALLDPEWLEEELARKQLAPAHVRLPGGGAGSIVLTASTKELQEFVMRHAGNERAFPWAEFRRLMLSP